MSRSTKDPDDPRKHRDDGRLEGAHDGAADLDDPAAVDDLADLDDPATVDGIAGLDDLVDIDDLDPPSPTIASIRVDEEDPIRDHLARQLNASTSFAAGAVALFWPLLFLWVLLRRWWSRGEESGG